jgi:hypothetical protein
VAHFGQSPGPGDGSVACGGSCSNCGRAVHGAAATSLLSAAVVSLPPSATQGPAVPPTEHTGDGRSSGGGGSGLRGWLSGPGGSSGGAGSVSIGGSASVLARSSSAPAAPGSSSSSSSSGAGASYPGRWLSDQCVYSGAGLRAWLDSPQLVGSYRDADGRGRGRGRGRGSGGGGAPPAAKRQRAGSTDGEGGGGGGGGRGKSVPEWVRRKHAAAKRRGGGRGRG